MSKPGRKCFQKKAYSHLHKANQAVTANYLRGLRVLKIYTCPHCLEYHLTHGDNRSGEVRKKHDFLGRMKSPKLRRKSRDLLCKTRMSAMLNRVKQKANENSKV